jgi:hypothetical protein
LSRFRGLKDRLGKLFALFWIPKNPSEKRRTHCRGLWEQIVELLGNIAVPKSRSEPSTRL